MLKDRLFTVLALFFAAGIAVGFVASPGGKAVCFFTFALLIAASAGLLRLSKKRLPDWKNAAVYALIASIGLTVGTGWAHLRAQPYEEFSRFSGREDTVAGIVTDSGSSETSSYVIVKAERSVNALPSGTKIRLYLDTSTRLLCGDNVTVKLTYGNLCGRDLRAEGIALNAHGTIVSREYADDPIGFLRRKGVSYCEKLYAPFGQQGLTEALLFREKSALSTEVSAVYRNGGLSHLLAISGLHLVVLMTILRRLLSRVGVPAYAADIVCITASVVYAILVGASPSILRAVFMMACVAVGTRAFKSIDGISSLSAALIVLLILNPYALFSVGLQLSFLSCLGILLLEPYAELLGEQIVGETVGRKKKLRKLLAGVAENFFVSAGAVLFTFPVVAFTFSEVSWIAPLLNLLVVPLFPYVLTLVLLSALVCPFWTGAASVLAFLPGTALRGLELALTALRESGIGSLTLPDGTAWLPAVFVCAALFGFAFLKQKRLEVVVTSSALFFVSTVVLAFLPG